MPDRVIGFDNHPDTFTGVVMVGWEADTAKVVRIYDKIAQEDLESWVQVHTTERDVIVMEASANSFAAVDVFRAFGRKTVVLESEQGASLSKKYCVTDRTDGAKLARLYISRLPRTVWVPDEITRQRREVFYAHRQAVADSTRCRQRLRDFLNQRRIRLQKGFRLTSEKGLAALVALREWSSSQQLLLTQYHHALREAHLRRQQLREWMAAEILKEPAILRLIRLCGLRHITAYALAAFIGDITRFASPKKLVAYIGLNPSVEDSGETTGPTKLRHHGCAPLRTLMIQSAQAILTRSNSALAEWGAKLKFRKGRGRAAVGVARKLVTAVWYCLSGLFTALEETPAEITSKINILFSALGSRKEEALGAETPKSYKARVIQSIKESHELVFRSAA